MLRKIFAALAGALALIATPPDVQKGTARGGTGDNIALPVPLTFAWPLYTL